MRMSRPDEHVRIFPFNSATNIEKDIKEGRSLMRKKKYGRSSDLFLIEDSFSRGQPRNFRSNGSLL
jgi:hypothetical protein